MEEILPNRISQHPLAEEDHPVQALLLQRPMKPFQVGVQVRTLWRQEDPLHALGLQDLPKRRTEFAVPIYEHVTLADEETGLGVGQILGNLLSAGAENQPSMGA